MPARRAVTAARTIAGIAGSAALAAGCTGSARPPELPAFGGPLAVAPTTSVPSPPPTTTTTAPRATTTVPTATARSTTTVHPVTTAAAPITGQKVAVTAAAYGATTATVSAYQSSAAGVERVLGPWPANVGFNGIAPPGAKRESDGRTPSGTYGFDFFFGVDGNPGVRFPYRLVTGPSIVWDDDPASPHYNEWVDDAQTPAGTNPEPMDQVPAYDYGAVIAYNDARTPGLGSAIFLHVSTGGPTAGCISLPATELLQVLRWLDPRLRPTINITVG